MHRKATQWALRRQKVPEHLIALAIALYSNARSSVMTLAVNSDKFGIGALGSSSRVSTESLRRSDSQNREAGVRFVNHEH